MPETIAADREKELARLPCSTCNGEKLLFSHVEPEGNDSGNKVYEPCIGCRGTGLRFPELSGDGSNGSGRVPNVTLERVLPLLRNPYPGGHRHVKFAGGLPNAMRPGEGIPVRCELSANATLIARGEGSTDLAAAVEALLATVAQETN